MMYCDEIGGEIIVAANDKDQASMIIYSKIRGAINVSPKLSVGVSALKTGIEVKSTGTICRCVAHQHESAAGLNPNCTLFDELWGFKDRKFYDELTIVPTRKNPLIVIVTYAGYEQVGLLWDLYQDGMYGDTLLEVPNREIHIKRGKNDTGMFMYWAHENMASWITPDYLSKQKKRLPPNVYARFHENRWSAAEAGFITNDDILRNIDPSWHLQLMAIPEKSYTYVCGLDLGLTHDRTARVVAHLNPEDQKVYLDSVRVWEGSPSSPVPIYDVERDLVEVMEQFGCRTLVIDPWQLESTIQKLRGIYNIKPFNFSADMSRLSETLLTLLRGGRFTFYDDPRLIAELRNIYARQTARGWKIDHISAQKNDIVIALGMVATECIRSAALQPQIWYD
ncbi:MAG: hypothetical protein DDT31_01845 [Syntrophomonadaceae bacterium]|nr:hypothetical protein [Bacillota bacterium]